MQLFFFADFRICLKFQYGICTHCAGTHGLIFVVSVRSLKGAAGTKFYYYLWVAPCILKKKKNILNECSTTSDHWRVNRQGRVYKKKQSNPGTSAIQ